MVKGPAPFDQGLFLMHLHKGKEYFEQNEFQKAREELEAAYHFRPQDEKVLNLLGMTYFKLEMLPQAEEMYVTLAANNPEIYTLQSNLGLIRLKLNKLEQAEESLTSALELQPTNPKAHFYLGLLYEKLQRWDKALVHFEHARADKMIARMKEKVAELTKDEDMLPFEILEVLVEEEAYAQQHQFEPGYMPEALIPEKLGYTREDTPYVSEKEIVTAESEWVEHNVSTGKMRRRDVIEALERLEQRESDQVEVMDDAVPMPGHPVEEEALWKDPLAASEEGRSREAPNSVEETSTEEAMEEQDSHEGTQFLQSDEAPSGASFLLAEETAADISTFLAQSRMEQEDMQHVAAEESASELKDEVAAGPGFMGENRTEENPIPESAEVEEFEEPSAEEESFFEEDNPLVDENAGEAPEVLAEMAENDVFVSEERTIDETQMMSAIVGGEAALENEPVTYDEEPAEIESTPVSEAEASVFTGERKLDLEPQSYQSTNLDQFSRDRFHVQPLIGADRFLLIDPHLLEIIISEKLVCRKGTISSFTGNLQFQPWKTDAEQTVTFIQVAGTGVLFLADRRQEIFIISLNNESIYVEANHLIVAQSALKVEPLSIDQGSAERRFSFLKISGRGTIALTCHTKPLTLNVFEAMPANIPAEAIIAWSGKLSPNSISDDELRNIMMSGQDSVLLRFSGNGDVVVEQGGLWGDRRSTQ